VFLAVLDKLPQPKEKTMSNDLECPYCGAENEVCHDDGAGYEEDVCHEMQCCECEKNFVFTTYISFSYTPYKADCLNDGEHQWEIVLGYPKHKELAEMRCKDCDKRRNMTDTEWYHWSRE
jgi:hypothetical protein